MTAGLESVRVSDEAGAEAALEAAGRAAAALVILEIDPPPDDPVSERLWRARVEAWALARGPAMRVCAVTGPGAAAARAYLAGAPAVTGVLLATD